MFLILEVRFFQCMRISVSAVGGHLLTWKRVGFLLLFFNFGKLFSFYEISFHLIFFIIPRIGQKGFHFFFACQLVSSFNKCPWQQMDGGEGKGEASQASYFVWTRSRNMHKLILFYSNRSKFKSAKRRERNTSCPLCHTEPLAGSESGSGSEFEVWDWVWVGCKNKKRVSIASRLRPRQEQEQELGTTANCCPPTRNEFALNSYKETAQSPL